MGRRRSVNCITISPPPPVRRLHKCDAIQRQLAWKNSSRRESKNKKNDRILSLGPTSRGRCAGTPALESRPRARRKPEREGNLVRRLPVPIGRNARMRSLQPRARQDAARFVARTQPALTRRRRRAVPVSTASHRRHLPLVPVRHWGFPLQEDRGRVGGRFHRFTGTNRGNAHSNQAMRVIISLASTSRTRTQAPAAAPGALHGAKRAGAIPRRSW
jgi:hypothetical protein